MVSRSYASSANVVSMLTNAAADARQESCITTPVLVVLHVCPSTQLMESHAVP